MDNITTATNKGCLEAKLMSEKHAVRT